MLVTEKIDLTETAARHFKQQPSEAALKTYTQTLQDLAFPQEYRDFQERIVLRLLEKVENDLSLSRALKQWSSEPAARSELMQKLARLHLQAFSEEMEDLGLNTPRIPPDIKFFKSGEKMPERGGYDEHLNLIYQQESYGAFNQAVYAVNWITHEVTHHTQYALIDMANEDDAVPDWLKESVAIMKMGNSDGLPQIAPNDYDDQDMKKLARQGYMYLPKEVDAMTSADLFTEKFLNCPVEFLTSPKRNPQALEW